MLTLKLPGTGLVIVAALTSPICGNVTAAAQTRSSPWSAQACNDTCIWWMRLGQTPAAEQAPAATADPGNAIDAATPPSSDRAPPRAAGQARRGARGLARGEESNRPARPAPHRAMPSGPRGGMPVPTLWNVPIYGSRAILPASFTLQGTQQLLAR